MQLHYRYYFMARLFPSGTSTFQMYAQRTLKQAAPRVSIFEQLSMRFSTLELWKMVEHAKLYEPLNMLQYG